VGYRIETERASLAYLPDHEPALGARRFPIDAEWTSGFELAEKVDLLLHDAQYIRAEYPRHVGWGHSTVHHALAFAHLVGARHLVAFHHDPGRDDAALEAAIDAAVADVSPNFPVTAAAEGHTFDLDRADYQRGVSVS
jgi:phosphoribosyl 1,2-cyclic phosphodiesterase